jgi:hypothetical protein
MILKIVVQTIALAFRKPNIFDNMMSMMEKYANNLEALVDERTDQLVEEKKKTGEVVIFTLLLSASPETQRIDPLYRVSIYLDHLK